MTGGVQGFGSEFTAAVKSVAKGAETMKSAIAGLVDSLADSIARADSRAGLVTRARALDRVLMHGYYMIPLFYAGKDMVARQTAIKRPSTTPVYGIVLESWWREEPANAAP